MSARSTRARRAAASSSSTATGGSSPSISASTRRSPRARAGSSTTPTEIWQRALEVIGGALTSAGAGADDLAAIGITNQRETTVIWDRESGEPIHNAIVWQDTRTAELVHELAGEAGLDRLRDAVGLPLSTVFLRAEDRLAARPRRRARASGRRPGELAFGTIDAWLLWNLTGGPVGGLHATDVTNASRTMLMDLRTLDWHEPSLRLMGIPRALLPQIRSSSEIYGEVGQQRRRPAVPSPAILGDQQAALFGQTCFERGEAKNTYGTGLVPVIEYRAEEIAHSAVLLTSVGYRLGDGARPVCARGLGRRHRGARPMAARPPADHRVGGARSRRSRGRCPTTAASTSCPPSRGCSRRAGGRRPRRDRRPDRLREPRAHRRARRSRPRPGSRREVVDAADGAAGVPLRELRVDGGMTAQRAAHAAAGRRARRARRSARRSPRRPRSARRTRPGWPSASGRTPTSCASGGPRTAAGSRRWSRRSASASTRAGARRSSGRWTGCSERSGHPRALRLDRVARVAGRLHSCGEQAEAGERRAGEQGGAGRRAAPARLRGGERCGAERPGGGERLGRAQARCRRARRAGSRPPCRGGAPAAARRPARRRRRARRCGAPGAFSAIGAAMQTEAGRRGGGRAGEHERELAVALVPGRDGGVGDQGGGVGGDAGAEQRRRQRPRHARCAARGRAASLRGGEAVERRRRRRGSTRRCSSARSA